MSVAKVSEINATSSKSFEDALKQGIVRATQTLRNVRSAWVKEQQVHVSKGSIIEYQINMMVTFVIEDQRRRFRVQEEGLDEDRANSNDRRGRSSKTLIVFRTTGPVTGTNGTCSTRRAGALVVDGVAAARRLPSNRARARPGRAARAPIWHWDQSAAGWERHERPKALFGYAEMVTDAVRRVNRIYPEERDNRVEATVTERAYSHDDAGPPAGSSSSGKLPGARARDH